MKIWFLPLVLPTTLYLFAALSQINFADLADEKHFGDLAVHIELDQPQLDHEEYALALPF